MELGGSRRPFCPDASPVLDLDGKVRPVVELGQTAEVTVGADGFTVPSE